MEGIRLADGVDVDAEVKRRAIRAPKQARLLHAIGLGWNTVEGLQRALSGGGTPPTTASITDHVRRLRDDGIVVYNEIEALLADIPTPGGIIDGLGE